MLREMKAPVVGVLPGSHPRRPICYLTGLGFPGISALWFWLYQSVV